MSHWVYGDQVRLPVWGENIPYNTGADKLADMHIDRSVGVEQAMGEFCGLLLGEHPELTRERSDTLARLCEIECGAASGKYDDVPYLAPYICTGAERAVIVVPGGGYIYEEFNKEGVRVAEHLAAHGVSAFVLKYRCYPYALEAPLADMRRAVRYVRHHAAEYGIDPGKIGAVGFSAGGFQVAAQLCLDRGSICNAPGYTPDAVDETSDRLDFAGLIYPVIDHAYNPAMLRALFDRRGASEDDIARLAREYYPTAHIRADDPPQFAAWGSEDTLIDPRGIEEYTAALERAGVAVQRRVIDGAGHGFGLDGGWIDEFIAWLGAL